MKRYALLLIAFCLLLVGCGKSKPKDLPQSVYDIASEVVPSVERYLNGNLDSDDLLTKLKSASDDIHNIYDSLSFSEQVETLSVNNALTALIVDVTSANNSWLTKENIDDINKDVKSDLSDLKKSLGL